MTLPLRKESALTSLAVCLPADLHVSEPLSSSVNWAYHWPPRALERSKWAYIEEKRTFSPPPQITPGEVSATPQYHLVCPKTWGQRRDRPFGGQPLCARY